eukprot:TRINITY_DN6861_c0_g2_i6.p1 TRINITY_DN6861_c0_g2~~TRINITY_DN6861_c0_g2_i6.p1  ORF type:complete len:203 (+),score=69.67 TRINITY_DN6861_c0_g2_i6:111-719(+)
MDLLVLGLPTSGKTSLTKVVFQKLPLHEAHSLGSSTSVEIINFTNNPYIQFKVYDIPSTIAFDEFCKPEHSAVQQCGALIYVIDAKATPYDKACASFNEAVVTLLKYVPKLNFEVFIHKVDGDTFTKGDEYKLECQKDIQTLIKSELASSEIEINVSYHFTSIYDHSLHDSFGKVIQKLWPQVHYIGNMLDSLITVCLCCVE